MECAVTASIRARNMRVNFGLTTFFAESAGERSIQSRKQGHAESEGPYSTAALAACLQAWRPLVSRRSSQSTLRLRTFPWGSSTVPHPREEPIPAARGRQCSSLATYLETRRAKVGGIQGRLGVFSREVLRRLEPPCPAIRHSEKLLGISEGVPFHFSTRRLCKGCGQQQEPHKRCTEPCDTQNGSAEKV